MAGMRGVAATKATGNLPTSLPLARAIGASIANAPDRGALLSYPNKAVPTKQEGAYTWFPTAMSEAHAFKGIATGEMTVPSPDGSQVKLRYERHVEEIDGNWTWIGRVVGGDPMQEAIITFGEKAVFGSIPQANGKPALSLQTRNGTVFAVQTDPSKVVSATKGHEDVMIPEAATLRSSMAAAVSQSAQVSQGATAVAQAAPPTAANTIDVAVGYTPEFATANGGASGAATRLVYLVQVGNQAFANSAINGYLRIVNAVQVSYTNTNTNQTALQELTGSTGSSPVTVPASLAPLRTARDQYGADIAVLVRKFSTPENEGCGIAWLNGANQTAITSADAAWGYAVISDGFDTGSDGKTYYCADETLVHEAAHLMGSAHDRANSTATGGALQYGRYPYSFGYKTGTAAGNFYTVMAYGDTGQTPHRIFSTPLKSTCGGTGNLACGVANSEDNARSLNLTIPVVAMFRATVVPFGNTKDDFDGDGRSDIYWRNTSTGANVIWKSASSSTQQYVYSLQLTWTVAGLGDFDGDGKTDILWRNYATGANAIWKNGDATSQKTISSVGTHWKVAAVGDFNGDGADDILWRNGRSNTIWKGGVASAQQAVTALDAAWTVAGVGDFNGDGVSDILWRNTTTGANAIWRSANSASVQSVATLATYWKVAEIGDFDGDGRADILWRNGASNAIWKSGSHLTQQSVSSVPAYWVVAAVADYDGDGKDDILWRNGSVNTIWRAANASTQQAVTSQPQAWVAQVPK
ncbi:FG-GAP-like repeat-containing protein [Pseudoxanthomonas japonensis]|nr:FG-GAP-like repeat-containing protein [Pseudoxanthomonas japonensis]